jgi:hypothetical protein
MKRINYIAKTMNDKDDFKKAGFKNFKSSANI